MNKQSSTFQTAFEWVWRHMAATVAVLLIVTAFVAGYRIGRPDDKPASPSAADVPNAPSSGRQMYTCSMHPWIRLPDPNAKCPICFMDLIPVTNDGHADETRRLTLSAAAAALSRIETTPVTRFFPTAEVRLFGKVTFDETSVARLTAYFPGRIERLFVNYVGVPVARGDHMAEVYSPDVLAAFEELRQAKAAVDKITSTSELVRSATHNTLAAAREKLRLMGITSEQIAAVEEGSFDADRLTVFAPIGGVVTNLAVREGDYVKTGEPIATIADLSRLWLDMEAYESQLPMLRWGQQVTFTVEAHPGETFEGRISFIEPMIDDRTRTAAVRVAVDNSKRQLKPGMFATAVVRTRLAASGAVFSNELSGRWVSPMHPTIVKDGPGTCDICGMDLVPAESLGVVGEPADAEMPLVIPRSAVLFTGTRSVVYVQRPDEPMPTFEGRSVVLGPRAGEFYIVRAGLEPGERVVVNGAFRIDSAMQIAAKPSMMTPGDAHPHSGHGADSANGRRGDPGRAALPEQFVSALEPVFAAYLDAQEALAADNLDGFLQAVSKLNETVEKTDDAGLIGEPLAIWRRAAALLRVKQPVESIDAARSHFERMSEGAIVAERAFGHPGKDALHLAHCPMAFDDKGADWLQRGVQINNPYFGSEMLRCGTISESFPPINSMPTSITHEGLDHERLSGSIAPRTGERVDPVLP